MAYNPLPPPSDPKALPAYLQGELRRITQELTNPLDYVRLREMAESPTKYADGFVVYADGTNWDPGGGEGLYVRTAGAWAKPGLLRLTSKSADYTLTLADANEGLFHPAADTSARTWTIPANASVAYPLWTVLTFVNQHGGGTISLAITSDTMRLAGPGTTGTRSLAQDGMATAVKITATEWIISGTGLT